MTRPGKTQLESGSAVDTLAFQIKAVLKKDVCREFVFHPTRKWRLDLFISSANTGVEVDGAVWANGRHNRGAGFIKDMEKLNEATAMGFRVYRFTTQQVNNGEAIEFLRRALEMK